MQAALPEENGQPMAFHLRCPCKRSHSVTHLGFLLLEKVEGTLGSAEQEVDSVFLGNLEEPCFSALESRASRQERKVRKVEAIRFVCNDQDPVEHTMGKTVFSAAKLPKADLQWVVDLGL